MIVIQLHWRTPGHLRQETFGLWDESAEDEFAAAISEFLRDWRKVTGLMPETAVLSLVQDPAPWLRAYPAQQATLTPASSYSRR